MPTCETARSSRWSTMVMWHALTTALVNAAMFELLPQRCHHAWRAPPQCLRWPPQSPVLMCQPSRWWPIGTYFVRQSCQHHGFTAEQYGPRANAQLSFLYSNMTCYQTLKSARTLSPSVTTWMRLDRALRARSSNYRLGLHAYGRGAYWGADGGVMPARPRSRTASDGSDGVARSKQMLTTPV